MCSSLRSPQQQCKPATVLVRLRARPTVAVDLEAAAGADFLLTRHWVNNAVTNTWHTQDRPRYRCSVLLGHEEPGDCVRLLEREVPGADAEAGTDAVNCAGKATDGSTARE